MATAVDRRKRVKIDLAKVVEVRLAVGPAIHRFSDLSIQTVLDRAGDDIELAITAFTTVPSPDWIDELRVT